jgi:hypothetical protein
MECGPFRHLNAARPPFAVFRERRQICRLFFFAATCFHTESQLQPLAIWPKDRRPDGPWFADVLITFAAQVAVVVMAIEVLANGPDISTLAYLCAGTMSVAALVQATVAFLVMRKSAAQESELAVE